MSSNPRSALEPLIAGFREDGYLVTVEEGDKIVSVRIEAGPDACAGCLVPPSVMLPLLTNALREAGYEQHVEVTYPDGT